MIQEETILKREDNMTIRSPNTIVSLGIFWKVLLKPHIYRVVL